VKVIVKSESLNVKKLERNDACLTLTFRKPLDWEFSTVTWLYRFWNYMNVEVDSTAPDPLKLNTIQNFPLVLVRDSSNKEDIKSMAEFHTEPIVVQPTINDHMGLCSEFPGLLVVDIKTLPISYQETEKSLFDPYTIKRFSRTISHLANKEGKSLTEYARATLSQKGIKVS
jgi:hypothetical protein